MLGSGCWECNKSHCLNFKYAYTHKFRHSSNSGQNISSCPCRGSQKPCSRTAIPESSLQGRKKIIKSNVTSEKRANIWEIKPKWISLAYFQQNKTAHFTSPPLSLLSSDCWVQALKAHTQLYRKQISHASRVGLSTELCTFKGTDRIASVLVPSTDSH